MSWTISGASKAPLLLDSYPGAAAAYSLRQLSWSYGGPVVRVRRSSDNTEADFTAAEVSGGTLASWVGAGNNGFVQTWYDQSGNGRNATQTASNAQPKIISSGSLTLIGSKPALDFDGSDDFLAISNLGKTLLLNNLSMMFVFSSSSTGGYAPLAFQDSYGSSTPWLVPFIDFNSGAQSRSYLAGNYGLTQSWTSGQPAIFTFKHLSNTYSKTYNGTNTVSVVAAEGFASEKLFIGNWYSGFMAMKFPELIVYNSNQSENQSAIESNINTHYSIY